MASGFGVGGCFWEVVLGDDGMAWWGISGDLGGFWGEERFNVNYPSHGSQRQSVGGVLPRAANEGGFIN